MRGWIAGGLLALTYATACSVLIDTSDLASGDTAEGADSAGPASLDGAVTVDRDATDAADAMVAADASDGADASSQPKLATLVEAFDDNTLHPTRWNPIAQSGYTVVAANRQLQISNSVNSNGGGYLQSVGVLDAVGSHIVVDLLQAGNAAKSPGPVAWMKLWRESGVSVIDAVEIGIYDGTLYAKHFVGGVGTTRANTPYLPVTMRSLRLREAGGTTFWDYASSAAGPWTLLFSEPNAFPLSAVRVELGAGAYPGVTGNVVMDSVNTTP